MLGLEASEIGVGDDFFRLGGDSIVAIRLVSRIRQRLGMTVSVKDIFQFKRIGALSAHIAGTAAAVEKQPEDEYVPFSLMNTNNK